jgi:hypothetical protein
MSAIRKFREASAQVYEDFTKIGENSSEQIIHGLELEGFILKPDGHIAPQSAQGILDKLDEGFDVESGGHQIEFQSEAVGLSHSNFDRLLDDIDSRYRSVRNVCEACGLRFVSRSIPLDLPFDIENELDLFTTDKFFADHRAHDQKIIGLLDKPFELKYYDGTTAFKMRDYTLGLALISGVHNNISFTKPQTAIRAYNLALQLIPIVCALGANGTSLAGRRLLKRDSRLHIGLMRENVLVEAERTPYLDAGLPLPLANGWGEYISRMAKIGFMLTSKELIDYEDDFEALFNNLREQSWAFVKIKIFPGNRLGIEFRPLSSQCNPEANVAFHMFVVWSIVSLLDKENFIFSQPSHLELDVREGLLNGPDAAVTLNGKLDTATNHFQELSTYVRSAVVEKQFATEEEFDRVVEAVRKAISFNSMELIDYDKYRNTIGDPFI